MRHGETEFTIKKGPAAAESGNPDRKAMVAVFEQAYANDRKVQLTFQGATEKSTRELALGVLIESVPRKLPVRIVASAD